MKTRSTTCTLSHPPTERSHFQRSETFLAAPRVALFLSACLVATPLAWAGGTPATGTVTDQLQTMGGGGAKGAVGDFVSTSEVSALSGNGLDAPYFYFIEVPPGTSALQVDVFDADVMAGGTADVAGERDQNRDLTGPVNTKARYRLFDPSGNLVAARFNYGDDVTPVASDNVWTRFFDSATAGITGGTTYADNFGTVAYSNNDGSANFAADWTETNDDGLANSGAVFITGGGALRLSNQGDSAPFTNQPSLERQLDLSAFSAAILSFDYTSGAGVDIISNGFDSGDSFAVEASSDGGATWQIVDEFGDLNAVQTGTARYDLTGFIAANTRVRLRITNRYAGANEFVDIDNLQIRASATANGPAPAAGHWQLEVDMSGTVNGEIAGIRTRKQDDVNAFGLRAHDGTPGDGGTELNMYANSYVIVGVNDRNGSRDYDFFPYITKGCRAAVHNFDFDADQPDPDGPPGFPDPSNPNNPPFGSIRLTSRTMAFVHNNATMSGNDLWQSEDVTPWTSANTAGDYGIWSMDVNISDWRENNYGPIYLGSEQAAAAPPTASPEAETFRIYFPTDAGTAPVKPHMSQFLAYATGPNPPAAGMTTRMAVTVNVENPTGSAGSITFSSPTNLVTANIPAGAETAYAGVAFVTTGTVVSQPTTGDTTGDITWNPGTLAPGSSESLVYLVDVTPAAAGNVVVTGTSGSGDGTRGTFLDETGAQTYTLGELCRLSTTTSPQTPALVSDFAVEIIDRQPVVVWRTAGEAQTVSLDLYRQGIGGKPIKVNPRSITAQLGNPQGGTYRMVDPGASYLGDSIYWLVETESNGNTVTHGPFQGLVREADDDADLPADLGADKVERVPHAAPLTQRERRRRAELTGDRSPIAEGDLLGGESANSLGLQAVSRARAAARIMVRDTGVYSVAAEQLSQLFGTPVRRVETLIRLGRLQLTVDGQDVAWRSVANGRSLEFYGVSADSPFSPERAYRLTLGRGEIMRNGPRPPAAGDVGPLELVDTVRHEQSTRPIVLMDIDPESDLWLWDVVTESQPTASVTFDVTAPVPGRSAELDLQLLGALEGTHTAIVKLNGDPIATVEVQDTDRPTLNLPVDSGRLVAGANTLSLELQGAGLLFLDGFDLTYSRYSQPTDHQLTVAINAPELQAGPFVDDSLRVLDLADPLKPRHLAHRLVNQGGGFHAFWNGGKRGPFLVVADSGVNTPRLELDLPSNLRDPSHDEDYLVIAPHHLLDAAQRLADYRQGQGLDPLVIDVADIYDELNHGTPDVRAIRDFLRHTTEQWSRAPRYVVLMGAGTYDYHDYLGLGGNPLPVLLANNGESLYGSDSALADFDGDGAADLPIGRIPVLTEDELNAFVDKLMAYEQSDDAEHQARLQILSDQDDGDQSFAESSLQLRGLLPPGFDPIELSLQQNDLDTSRQVIQDALASGTGWLHYTGHGGVDRLSGSGMLTSADVPGLTATLPTVVSSATCLINYHSLPGFDSLGEELILSSDAGAVAVLAPTWLARHHQTNWVAERLFREVFQLRVPTLGDAIKNAMSSAAALGVPPELLGTYQLLGDPAMEIKVAPSNDGGDTCEPNCGGPG